MKPLSSVLIAIVLAMPFAGCGDPIADLTPQSEFIFVGTVLLLNSSTIDIENPEGLAVVRVEDVVRPSEGFAASRGDQITVRLRDPRAIQPSTKRLFFAKSWYFGESLGVVEIANLDPPDQFAEVQQEVTKVRQREEELALKERIRRAEVIVRGVVLKVSPLGSQKEASEHAPDWYTADIRVEEILKGRLPDQTVTIVFPHSDDIMWYRSPKFVDSTRGVWLLRSETVAGRKLPYRSALEKEDFFPQEDETTILQLLK